MMRMQRAARIITKIKMQLIQGGVRVYYKEVEKKRKEGTRKKRKERERCDLFKMLTFAVTLPHDHRAHEDFNGPDSVEDNLALSSGLVHSKCSSELILTDSALGVDFVAQHEEGGLGQILHVQERLGIQREIWEKISKPKQKIRRKNREKKKGREKKRKD